MPITLLDLSNNNPPVDFRAVKRAGAFGVLLKVSEGEGFADPTWPARARLARSEGLHVGGYHFARPNTGNAEREADYFSHLLGSVGRRDLHPALDLEVNDYHMSGGELLAWVRWFQRRVHENTGARCLLYSYWSFIASQRWTTTPGTGAGLWVSDYGPNDGHDHGTTAPPPWKRYVAHQFTSTGQWPGVRGNVDLSHARSRRAMLAHGLKGLLH